MTPLQRILLPVDFSELTAGAARYAKALARPKTELYMVHVVQPIEYAVAGGEAFALQEWFSNRVAQARVDIETYLQGELEALPVKRIVLEGDPAGRLVQFAHDEHIDLIV